jgi:predicted amidophosphoribosyltransferase
MRRRAMEKKYCLYCGLHLPDSADFCPECGRSIEEAIRVESEAKIRSAIIATGCLYCGLHLPDSAVFCPECGRPIERSLEIHPIQGSEIDYLYREMKGKDTPKRQQGFYYDANDPLAPTEEDEHPEKCPKREASLDRREGITAGVLSTR